MPKVEWEKKASHETSWNSPPTIGQISGAVFCSEDKDSGAFIAAANMPRLLLGKRKIPFLYIWSSYRRNSSRWWGLVFLRNTVWQLKVSVEY